jgi:hypothetical protein
MDPHQTYRFMSLPVIATEWIEKQIESIIFGGIRPNDLQVFYTYTLFLK